MDYHILIIESEPIHKNVTGLRPKSTQRFAKQSFGGEWFTPVARLASSVQNPEKEENSEDFAMRMRKSPNHTSYQFPRAWKQKHKNDLAPGVSVTAPSTTASNDFGDL